MRMTSWKPYFYLILPTKQYFGCCSAHRLSSWMCPLESNLILPRNQVIRLVRGVILRRCAEQQPKYCFVYLKQRSTEPIRLKIRLLVVILNPSFALIIFFVCGRFLQPYGAFGFECWCFHLLFFIFWWYLKWLYLFVEKAFMVVFYGFSFLQI